MITQMDKPNSTQKAKYELKFNAKSNPNR